MLIILQIVPLRHYILSLMLDWAEMGALCPQKLLEGKRDLVRSLATSVPATRCPVQS